MDPLGLALVSIMYKQRVSHIANPQPFHTRSTGHELGMRSNIKKASHPSLHTAIHVD